MGKIPNWSVKKDRNRNKIWQHDEHSRAKVKLGYLKSNESVTGISGSGPAWVLRIRGKKGREKMAGGKFSSREKARRKAVKWMRKHPDA